MPSLKELNDVMHQYNIPSLDELLDATKENPLQWNGYMLFNEPSTAQNEESFQEQQCAIKLCTKTVNKYSNIFQNSMIKSCTISGYAGC
eukprot:15328020-Ditylum_brightwellii.AAC.1